MQLSPDYQPEFESLTDCLLEVAQIRSVALLLERVVTRLAERPHIALARVWLLEPRVGAEEGTDRAAGGEVCLRLAASAGKETVVGVDGDQDEVLVGQGNVGGIAARGRQVVVNDAGPDFGCFAAPERARAEGIRGFNGQPIVFGGELLGVLAIYLRIPTPPLSPVWVRIFADHIAASLVNARAFEENERLKARIELENAYLREEVREAKSMGVILGRSRGTRVLLEQVSRVAPTDATVLILGESGTGKELVARELHRQSQRADRPLIRVNCASVPRELFESEFFGHVKGAFTGALRDRAGRFEAADGGTLFLDEVGEIPRDLQSKFLRVLQEKQYERVGEERTRSVDVRILAATNRDLSQEVAAGRFRQDLYYRLSVFPIEVAPLRDRRDDIPLLAQAFLEQAAQRLRVPCPAVPYQQLAQLQSYDWPGNVRELQNVVERAVILARHGQIRFDLPGGGGVGAVGLPERSALALAAPAAAVLTEKQLRVRESANLRAVLELSRWKVHGPGGAAERLGVKPTTLISRMKKLGLRRPSEPAQG